MRWIVKVSQNCFGEMNDLCAIKRASLFDVIDRCNFLRNLTGGDNRCGACVVQESHCCSPNFASLLSAHAKKRCRDKKAGFFDRLEKQVENYLLG
jgi:hypothetical protein